MNKNTQTAFPAIAARKFTRDLDITREELVALLTLASQIKQRPQEFYDTLSHRYVTLLFEKPSLRTLLTFQLAIRQLGGDCVTMTGPVGDREPVKDVARNVQRWTHCIVARTFKQETIEELARWASIPVVNALSDLYHPCQALADMLTLKERFGELAGIKLAFVGDGNNVAHSLMLDAVRLGMEFRIATPPGYEPKAQICEQAERLAASSGGRLVCTHDPVEAVTGAHAVYTDVWTSMGFEGEAEQRRRAFQPYQVTPELMARALPEAVFMHCLPARRGEETVDEVIESERSVVFDQAENRLHTQKALLLMLLA